MYSIILVYRSAFFCNTFLYFLIYNILISSFMSFIPEMYFFLSIYFIFFFFTLRNYSSTLSFLTNDSIIYVLYLCSIAYSIILIGTDASYYSIYVDNYLVKSYFSTCFSIFLFILFFFLVLIVKNYFCFLHLSSGVYLFVLSNSIFCLNCLLHSTDFFFSFVLLECISISLYIVCGYNKKDIESVESALKYFIIGTFSSIILVLGFSFLFALFNTLNFEDLELFFLYERTVPHFKTEIIACLVLISLGLMVKTYSAPFHYWALDIYEGAPLTSSFFFSTIYLSSILFFFFKIYIRFFLNYSFFQYYFFFFGFSCLLFGTFGTIFQRKIRKLLAYSSVNTVGFILLSFSTFDLYSIEQSFFFFFLYIINVGCLFIVLISIRITGSSSIKTISKISDFSILKSSNEFLGFIVVTCFFLASGIPPFFYFISKSFLFSSLTYSLYIFIVLCTTLLSLISYFYFLRIVKIIYYPSTDLFSSSYSSSKLDYFEGLILSVFFLFNIVSFLFFDFFSNLFFLYIISI